MKLALCVAGLLAIVASPASAVEKEKDCTTIKSITVRQACLDRQAAAHPERKTGSTGMTDTLEQMKREDDALTKKLRTGICRGC